MNSASTQASIKIGADGIDVQALEKEILETVEKNRAAGMYDEERVARAERNNILTMQDDEHFMEQYTKCLRQIIAVDINDFEIIEHNKKLAPVLKPLKKIIWKLLKFYTYRLWSQQNQTNNVLLAAIEIMERRNKKQLSDLSARIEALEKQLAACKRANPEA